MTGKEKLLLLKSLGLLKSVPESSLKKLADFLVPETHSDGALIFAEGTPGDSLYFISSGHVRVAKKLDPKKPGSGHKELAILGPGDSFGEMALFESVARSADTIASGDAVLLKLGHRDLKRWLDAHPLLAMGFFAQLVQVLSSRLRRSSSELALLFELSQWLLEPFADGKDLLERVLEHLVPRLEGSWRAGAYLYNEFNDEMDLVSVSGDFAAIQKRLKPPSVPDSNSWLDDATYRVLLPGKKRVMGHIIFNRSPAPSQEERNELARTLTTLGRLIASGIENIGYRTEENLRSRLRTNMQSGEL